MMFSHLLPLLFGVVSVAAKDQRLPLSPGGVPTDRVSTGGTRKFIIEVEQVTI